MDNSELENLLMEVGAGRRDAFRALFDTTAPEVAVRIASQGASQFDAEAALIKTYSEIWQGDYSVPMKLGQGVADWVGTLAMGHVKRPSSKPETPIEASAALWEKVKQRAYPENWRNIVRRTDVVFAVVGALVWALILLVFQR